MDKSKDSMMSMNKKHTMVWGVVAAVLAAVLLSPAVAHAETILEYEPSNNPVADNFTRLEVNKLDKNTREYLAGAKLAVIEEATGDTIDKWVSTGEAHEISRALNVSVNTANPENVYILRELEAPKGYEKVGDVRFALFSVDFNTKGTVLESDGQKNAEFTDIAGSGSEQAFVINLLDPPEPQQRERVIHKNREVKQYQKLAQTGDMFKVGMVVGLAAGGACIAMLGLHLRKRDANR